MKKTYFIALATLTLLTISCGTVHFDSTGTNSSKIKTPGINSYEEEQLYDDAMYKKYLIEEELKNISVDKTVVYIEKPVYYPVEEKEAVVKGRDAVKKSTESANQQPEKFINGTIWYDYDDDFTYEIYCQPYRTTDIQLEPGEQVIEMPFLSENKVWEIGAGVSRVSNMDTQHFFLKPAYSGLITSLIIITDKRIYHLLLKSFKDTYMTQVKWEYPNKMPFTLGRGGSASVNENGKYASSKTDGLNIDPRYLSFDYKMHYSMFKKPYWLPYRIYDDGAKTYINMNETVLHMTTPVLFDNYKNRINYSVTKNLIVIPELIEKVTLRIGRQKVVIKKKNYKPTQEDIDAENEALITEKILQEQLSENKKNRKSKKTTVKKIETGSENEIVKEEPAPKRNKGLHLPIENQDGIEIPVQDLTAESKS